MSKFFTLCTYSLTQLPIYRPYPPITNWLGRFIK